MTAKTNGAAPQISPTPFSDDCPLWSVMIPTYNCANYLKQTLESVLRQDPGPTAMQIEVIDDCSTQDDPEAVVKEIGQGRVQFFRQPANVGAIANFNTCIQHAKGKIVHILHGDDVVEDGFYYKLGPPLQNDDTLGAAFCRQTYINEHGDTLLTTRLEQPVSSLFENALSVLAVSNRIPPPAIVIKRQVYEQLGGYDPRLYHAADWEMWVRIAAHYSIWYQTEPLALYRVHSGSDTSRLFETGANMQNRREAIEIFQDYLPPQQSASLARKALAYSAIYGFKMALKSLKPGRMRLFANQLREALICAWQMVQANPSR